MEILRTVAEASEWSGKRRQKGETICLVPTMGYFHQGHLSLMKTGKKMGHRLVVSIFVNPSQFGENEDLASYPTDIENDISLARKEGASAVFLPDSSEMYPEGYETWVELSQLPGHLCGISRPVHFTGVATVVLKLFNIIRPAVAVFGEKDFQQLQVIRRMVKDLNCGVKIVGAPIVRESDGLAMSSRNSYLTPDERRGALSLSKSLELGENRIKSGVLDGKTVEEEIKEYIRGFPHTKIDYVRVCDRETLKPLDKIEGRALLALAVWVGKTRLIDNRVIDPPQ